MRGEPRGSVRMELLVTGTWAISLLTEGWTEKEKQRLMDGDRVALNELFDRAEQQTLRLPDDVEPWSKEVHWSPDSSGAPGRPRR